MVGAVAEVEVLVLAEVDDAVGVVEVVFAVDDEEAVEVVDLALGAAAALVAHLLRADVGLCFKRGQM